MFTGIGLVICAIISGITMYTSIIKEKYGKHHKIIFMNMIKNINLNIIEVLIFRALIDSYISFGELVLVNNALR